MKSLMLKRVLAEILFRRQSTENLRFGGIWGETVKFRFRNPQKAHPCTKWHLKIGTTALRVASCQNPKK